jgi:predicted nuclease of predicted toxin-antitoxin system
LRAEGHDVVYAGEWTPDPGDDQILAFASQQDRIVVTLDKDFGTLAILRNQSHCGIIRLVDIAASRQAMACLSVLGLYGQVLAEHGIVTAEPGRVRVRPAPRAED